MEGTQEQLLIHDTSRPPINDVESRPIYKIKKKKKCGCCRFCCKILCIGFAITFFIILLLILVPIVKDAFAPVKTEVNWSAPHTSHKTEEMKRLADRINGENRTWKARYNPFAHPANSPIDEMFSFSPEMWEKKEKAKDAIGNAVHFVKEGIIPEDRMADTIEHLHELLNSNITVPSSFDAREKWSRCASIHQISNQGACGSCWAMAASTVMSDRLCISSNYTRQETISAQDLLSCCPNCGSCGGGGFLISAFKTWKERGLVSGGLYGSNEGCKPYQIDNKCGYPCSIDYYTKDRTPKCEEKCQPIYSKTYEEDLIKSRKAYWLQTDPFMEESDDWRVGEQREIDLAIKKEISSYKKISFEDLLKIELFVYGPVMGCLIIEEPFLVYESGIYSWEANNYMYSHCMRLIGWGEEGGVKYWTFANSWGRNWGENGFIRIDINSIPSDIAAGIF